MGFLSGLHNILEGLAQTPAHRERHQREMARLNALVDDRYREGQRIEAERRARQRYGATLASNGEFEGHIALIETGRTDHIYGPVTDIYFGGRGGPLGAEHGHVVLTSDHSIIYRRDPGTSSPSINSRTGQQ